jgi:hypothetical protein
MDVYKNYYIARYGNKKFEVVTCLQKAKPPTHFRDHSWRQVAIVNSIEEGERYIEKQTGIKYSHAVYAAKIKKERNDSSCRRGGTDLSSTWID